MKNEKRWYQKISNWLTIIAVVILVPVLLINLSIMFQANTDKDKVPSVFGFKPFIVLSGSMETDIRVGDLIITKEVDPTTLKIGDVIAFRDAEGTVTTHRIIEIVDNRGEDSFITKGDNNSSQDQQLVELSDVEGIYVARIPSVGNVLKSLSEPTTIIIVVLAITVVFAVAFMLSNKKSLSQEQLEFLEYKRKKEQAERDKENEEFMEFKRQKALKEKDVSENDKTSKEKTTKKTTGTKKESSKSTETKKKTTKKTNSK
ncbi:MAG: signal peptidase I [Bacilli bacterium]|nr:signal peptidase I [Bacilli bacterium]